jgi:hypothetical protein
VNASGVQIYECEENSNATGLVYTSVGAMATLYSPDGVNGNDTSVGYHYFLNWPLAEGGKPTYSFSVKAGDPISAIPESTVTGRRIFYLLHENPYKQKYKDLFLILQLP